ncbi:MAG TPA: alpha/beta fold hydrolase [Ramlibacter sp.]|jgi:pimeloyl-ACP methyl ester carboxylesterase
MPVSSRLARLLRTVCGVQVLFIVAVVAWRWPTAPAQAILGAILIAAIAPIVLAIEFVLLATVARHDTVPRARAPQLARAWAGEVADLLRVFYWRLPFRWNVVPDFLDPAGAGRTGVVLIHGFVCNRGFWTPWLHRLRDQRRACIAVNLEPVFGSIDDYVPIIEDAVTRVTRLTGRPPVLVCHSMGGLAARAWLRGAGSASRVAHVVTIGTPHRGTWLGRFSSMRNGREMRQHSGWLSGLERVEALQPLPPCTCWYSNCDNIVFPPSTATLPGAENRLVAGLAHVAMAFHPPLVDATFLLLETPMGSAGK